MNHTRNSSNHAFGVKHNPQTIPAEGAASTPRALLEPGITSTKPSFIAPSRSLPQRPSLRSRRCRRAATVAALPAAIRALSIATTATEDKHRELHPPNLKNFQQIGPRHRIASAPGEAAAVIAWEA
jgi:hypothetical protein